MYLKLAHALHVSGTGPAGRRCEGGGESRVDARRSSGSVSGQIYENSWVIQGFERYANEDAVGPGPTRAQRGFPLMRPVPQSAEDFAFGGTDLAEGCRNGVYDVLKGDEFLELIRWDCSVVRTSLFAGEKVKSARIGLRGTSRLVDFMGIGEREDGQAGRILIGVTPGRKADFV